MLEHIEGLIEASLEKGRKPALVEIAPAKIPAVEADAEARGVLGRGTIFGVPYAPNPNNDGDDALLRYTDGPAGDA